MVCAGYLVPVGTVLVTPALSLNKQVSCKFDVNQANEFCQKRTADNE